MPPKHIAIIMDGNGRWAKKRLLPRSFGHRKGMERMVGLLEHAFGLGVQNVTVYALSTENLKRPKEELDGLFGLIRAHFTEYMKRICAKGAKLKVLGDLSLLPEDIQEILRRSEADCDPNAKKQINVALAYGARAEIVAAVNRAVREGKEVTEASFAELLYTAGQPDPDLIIRTGKEVRLSNFLMYQAAYAELYFSDKMFPEFSNRDLEKAIEAYCLRTRRFGETDEQRKAISEENLAVTKEEEV